ncbi:hypothetical protein BV25DRAFT_1828696 [Artomyces pyxidatus]|uniref:Uncharacterized protein n=1 Tax=Artomyces pyxidatus TaxID=48021 RepID=A0ACB8STZ7_9AGAM|nr:hypothetical protein BV25DRAFT_1828696 [Artomyces pyxidatus]
MATETSLLLLPNELLLGILETLPGRDVLACNSTCRHLRDLITGSVALQYSIELFACGTLDGAQGPHTVPVPDRLDRLRHYAAAWERLLWTNHISLPHVVGFDLPLVVSGDTLLLLRVADLGGTVSRVYVQRLPSALRDIEEHRVIPRIPAHSALLDFTISSDQDLLVFRELRDQLPPKVHIRSLSTGEIHPLAGMLSVMDAAAPITNIHDLHGDFLLEAVGVIGSPDRLHLRNWKSGVVEAEGMPISFENAIFLDDHHILSVESSTYVLHHQACVRVTSFVTAKSAPVSYVFALPDFMRGIVNYARPYTRPLETTIAPRGCFYPDPSDRLITIEIELFQLTRGFAIDVLAHTFTRYIAAHPTSPDNSTISVPWHDWGTHGARVTVDPGVYKWTVSGARRAIVRCRDADRPVATLTVLDYSPRRVGRAIARGTANVLYGSEVITDYAGPVFGPRYGPLRTLLPCIATEIPFPDDVVGDGGEELRAFICENGVLFTRLGAQYNTISEAWAYTI